MYNVDMQGFVPTLVINHYSTKFSCPVIEKYSTVPHYREIEMEHVSVSIPIKRSDTPLCRRAVHLFDAVTTFLIMQ
jgi:hypothetical protein